MTAPGNSRAVSAAAACDRSLRSRKRAKTNCGRRYLYYRCSGYDKHDSEGRENPCFASATKLEGSVRGAMPNPEELRSDLNRTMGLERDGR